MKTLLDEQGTLTLSPIVTQSNISQFGINQVYFWGEGVDSDIEETTRPDLQESSLVLEVKVL